MSDKEIKTLERYQFWKTVLENEKNIDEKKRLDYCYSCSSCSGAGAGCSGCGRGCSGGSCSSYMSFDSFLEIEKWG